MNNTDDNWKRYEAALVRIYRNEKVIGSGFLFAENYVLTCAHVVKEALNLSASNVKDCPQDEITLDFPFIDSNTKLKANVKWWKPALEKGLKQGEDIAILQIQNKIPENVQPCQLTLIPSQENDSIFLKGFPEPDGRYAGGTVKQRIANGLIQMEGEVTGYIINEGFSGSPIWNRRLENVVGIAVAQDRNQPQAKVAFMIPNSVLQDVVPEEYDLFEKLPSYTDSLMEEYQDIIPQLKGGLVIPFIGPGVDRSLYTNLECALTDKVGELILTRNQWNALKNEAKGKKELINQLIGIPWPECPYLINERPNLCPVSGGLTQLDEELHYEQDLSVIKRNIRYFSLYCKFHCRSYNESDDEQVKVFYHDISSLLDQTLNNLNRSKFYEFLARRTGDMLSQNLSIPFKLIITTNFDTQLTKEFDDLRIPYDLVFYVAEGSEKGKFKHQSPDKEVHITNSNYKFEIGKRPIILQLYGRWDKELFENSVDYKNYFFVIDEMQFHGLLNDLKNLPAQLIKFIQQDHLLFIGYNSNDYELQMIMHQLHQIKRDFKLDDSWLITQNNPENASKLSEKIWSKFNTIIKPISQTLEGFSQTLQEKI